MSLKKKEEILEEIKEEIHEEIHEEENLEEIKEEKKKRKRKKKKKKMKKVKFIELKDEYITKDMICKEHPNIENMKRKCLYCCSMSVHLCHGGTVPYCDACHIWQEKKNGMFMSEILNYPVCDGRKSCPLYMDHPPNGCITRYTVVCMQCIWHEWV